MRRGVRVAGTTPRAVFVAIALACASATLAAQAPPSVFRTGVDGVRVDVAVTQRGRPVTNLRLDGFALLDSGVPQQLITVSYDALAIDVTVALDATSSVQGNVLRELRRGIERLRERLRPGDRLRVLTFGDRIRRIVDFTDPRANLTEAFARIVPAGQSAIFDTLAVALTSETSPDRRQLVMTFSDGVDNMSTTDPDALLAVARHTTPTLGFVLPRPAGAVGPGSRNWGGVFADLAAETGGAVIQVDMASEAFNNPFGDMLDRFRSAYVLHYVPTGVPEPGFHPLTVQVPRGGPYEIRARRGYVRN